MTTADAGISGNTAARNRTVAEALAEQAVRAREVDPGDAVRRAAIRAVVDWFGATFAGSIMAAPQILRAAVLCPGHGGPSRLIPDGRKAPCRTAALLNATAAHAAELDDIYRDGIYHPGAPTIAAALAVAERLHASGNALIRAVITGYEVGGRVSVAVNPSHYKYWHTTGTVGTLGAAAAVAELLGLSRPAFAHALTSAVTMAAGLQQAFRSDAMSKPLHAGHAAEAGVLAALAAARGFTGALNALEGDVGFGAAMSRAPDWAAALAGPGDQPVITQITVKNHSCCGHTFAAVDAALALRAQGLRPEEISSVQVDTYTVTTTVAGNPEPASAFEARFSTQFCVAAALATGSVRLRAFEEPILSDPGVRSLMRRVTLAADPVMDKGFPGQRSARVTIRTRSGEDFTVERSTRKGDPDDPLTDDELRQKFTELVSGVISLKACARLESSLWRLPLLADVSRLYWPTRPARPQDGLP